MVMYILKDELLVKKKLARVTYSSRSSWAFANEILVYENFKKILISRKNYEKRT